MTAAEYLRDKASRLKHATARDIVFDAEGKFVSKNDYHYLSCLKCKLEKEANELERSTK